ncbi:MULTISPECIES: hypothetical protein [Hymenobacter]|uniref:DNA-binding protein n=1 Tax=Hymenobacter duratus TaxID=2771356 RepID=A0ABR8JGY4_9BACT|nr:MULTISPECIES: hypothetical protein [Hymenobacter]MBC6697360.1 hypothetical protein [Hymenobacter sp. BT190]MBD2714074.1 hypothetical protein [Hymenobacter duratus]MBR7948976.1 hypothetical protein [Microvirga sp. STR05]
MTELSTTTADGLHITVRLPDDHAWVRESLEKACAAEARRQLETAPTPDPAYSVPRTAALLDLHPETLRDYMRLPEHHPRRLHYLAGESSRGDRVLLSQIHDWQRRNRTDGEPVAAPGPRAKRGRRSPFRPV